MDDSISFKTINGYIKRSFGFHHTSWKWLHWRQYSVEIDTIAIMNRRNRDPTPYIGSNYGSYIVWGGSWASIKRI